MTHWKASGSRGRARCDLHPCTILQRVSVIKVGRRRLIVTQILLSRISKSPALKFLVQRSSVKFNLFTFDHPSYQCPVFRLMNECGKGVKGQTGVGRLGKHLLCVPSPPSLCIQGSQMPPAFVRILPPCWSLQILCMHSLNVSVFRWGGVLQAT